MGELEKNDFFVIAAAAVVVVMKIKWNLNLFMFNTHLKIYEFLNVLINSCVRGRVNVCVCG